jgi:hypothetical protein
MNCNCKDDCFLVKELEKENAELDCQKNRNKFCYSCANATERCFRNEIGCPCEKYKSYKDENAELKKDCIESEENNNKLQEDNQKLDVAKDLINRLLHTLVLSNTPYERYEEIQKEAEQFLNSEVEK